VLAAVIEYQGKILLARNAAWPNKSMYALITGFMEAGESPQAGIAREVKEETNLDVTSLSLIGVYEFLRMNQVIIAYGVQAQGDVRLSPELVDYRLYDFDKVKCWPAGTAMLAELRAHFGVLQAKSTVASRKPALLPQS
jgi:NAD+ diphosphatase